MAEKSDKQNLHIHLNGNKYLVSDNYSYWIVSESRRRGKDGEMQTVQTRLTGYLGDISDLMLSYYDNTVKKTEMSGEIEDLVKLVKKTRREIKTWFAKFDGAYEGEGE